MNAIRRLNKKNLQNLLRDRRILFLVSSLLGGVFFVSFFGFRVIDPTFTDWLMYSGDLKQHFIGWVMYRESSDPLSLGLIKYLAYPFGLPLTYMDSIPLIGIPLAFFSNVLPKDFQYFGIWGLLCFMLQGGFSALIIRKWTKNIVITLLFSSIFLLSPMLLSRVFSHTALASHWLILAAIWVVLEWRKFASLKKQVAIWTILLTLVVLIHPYFLPMIGTLFMVSVVLTHRKWLSTLIKIILPPGIAVIVFWMIGGFSITESSSDGLGGYAFNLNSLVNPLGWSKFLNSMPNLSPSGETLNYLGLGVILLFPIAFYLALSNVESFKQIVVNIRKLTTPRGVLISLLILFLFILAASPRLQFGTLTLFNISLPQFIEEKWAIFRASARLFWPIYYLIIVSVFAYIIVKSRGKISETSLIVLMTFCVLIQAVDIGLSQAARSKRNTIITHTRDVYRSTLSVDEWRKLMDGDRHMVYLGKMTNSSFFELSDVAMKYDLSMNDGYFSRSPKEQVASFQNDQKKLLLLGAANVGENLYVTTDGEFAEKVRSLGRYTVSSLDGYYVVH